MVRIFGSAWCAGEKIRQSRQSVVLGACDDNSGWAGFSDQLDARVAESANPANPQFWEPVMITAGGQDFRIKLTYG